MYNRPEKHWDSNTNAPPTPYLSHSAEKRIFTGFFICGILFFHSINALLGPADRTLRGGGLVLHIAIVFSRVTLFTAITFDGQSVSYIDHREFPGDGDVSAGPSDSLSAPIYSVTSLTPLLNNWLADGLLVSHMLNLVFLAFRVTPLALSL